MKRLLFLLLVFVFVSAACNFPGVVTVDSVGEAGNLSGPTMGVEPPPPDITVPTVTAPHTAGPTPTSILDDLGITATIVEVTATLAGIDPTAALVLFTATSTVVRNAPTATTSFSSPNSFVPTATRTNAPNTQSPTYTKTTAPVSTNTAVPTYTYTVEPSATHVPAPTDTSAPVGCSPAGNGSFESQVISLINQERAKVDLGALSANGSLTSAARRHSEDMACNDFFSHTSPTTGSPFDRILAAGYSYSAAAENIGAGYGSPAAVVDAWMKSSGHKANILGENYVHVGLGYAYWSGSTYGHYWTATFGAP